ncbi:MAG TPA: prolyl oligopeptidase family serine peptidase [Terracidiphilus sp.]|nr:prolyl oligopeptidase family serine peptidase [Terracidiphilus sp.]
MRGVAYAWLILWLGTVALAQGIHGRSGIVLPAPPAAAKQPVTDDYFGTKVTDDYRWLEDAKSPETRAFITAENAYTTRYLKQARIRPQVVDELEALEQVSSWSLPVERNGSYFFMKRIAGEQQASIYMRKGWKGRDERLVDPAALSRDPNMSIELEDVSRDGSLVAYGVREGGADETTIHVYDVKQHKTLGDALPGGLYWSVNFMPDGKGIFYTRTDRKGSLLFEHMLGTRNFEDKLLFGHQFYDEPLGGNDLFTADVTDDGRYLVVTIFRGVPPTRVDIVFRDLTKPDSPFEVLVWAMDSRFSAIYAKGAWYVKTDFKAPLGRIVQMIPGVAAEAWKTIVPESKNVIEGFSIVGGKVYVNRLVDAKTETEVYGLDGKPEGTVAYDRIGTASDVYGKTTDRYGFFSFQSFIQPPTLYRLDTVTGAREVFAAPKVPFDPGQYELKQVLTTSKDGTRVPMFVAGKKGMKRDGTERLLMTGYGGFNVSMTPVWNPQYAWWMQQGGWFAMPNLRGGGEYGEQWHEQGMFGKKQNVFDDFYAAARYLIENKYTSPRHFAITGRSNGGLLMGAAMTQQPQLFSAVLCGYPLLDMLRYQKFEQGPHWMTEYGSSDNGKQFDYLLKYSPYQNVHAGTRYPAIMFFTGESDTRVDPLHARKMTALMQAESGSGRPVLLHYSVSGGHSAGVSVDQKVQDDADQLTFLWTETGPVAAGK